MCMGVVDTLFLTSVIVYREFDLWRYYIIRIKFYNFARYLFLCPMHACPRHGPRKPLRTAKPCKGETRVPDAIIGSNQLRETTSTENPRSSKVAVVEHKASNLVSENVT